jgi:beta-glucosidase
MLNFNIRRLTVEWAKIEPVRGKYDADATAGYRGDVISMKGKGVKPLLALQHTSLPKWFKAAGGFSKPGNIQLFLDFVTFTVTHLGDLVNEYITFVGPNGYVSALYKPYMFPWNIPSVRLALKTQSVMASCHMEAYELINQLREDMGFDDTLVGYAHQVKSYEPVAGLWQGIEIKCMAYLFQYAFIRAFLSGWFDFPLKKHTDLLPDVFADFIGVGFDAADVGVTPEKVVHNIRQMHGIVPLPVYVFGKEPNGQNDRFSSSELYELLNGLSESNITVERFYDQL